MEHSYAVKDCETINVFFCLLLFFRENLAVYEAYKSSCVAFFIDIVKEFVFEEQNGQQLSEDVITKLMTYVCSSTGTKKFSPIAEHALDPSPVIRSFLLKQLLER